MEIVKGSIVKSTAGREKDRFFLVLSLEGDYLFLADGKERKLAAPKRKKRKHVSPTLTVFKETKGLTDKKLRRILQNWNAQKSE